MLEFCYFKQSTFVVAVALKRRHSGVNMSHMVTTVYYWLSYVLTIPDSMSDNNYPELVLNEKRQTQQTRHNLFSLLRLAFVDPSFEVLKFAAR